MEIRIALTNLGKYNEGELTYAWLDLPATDEEIAEAFKAISVAPNTEYEEHFISDYEAPFTVGEHESIRKLNELAERLEDVEFPEKQGLSSYKYYDAGDIILFASNLEDEGLVPGALEYVADIVDTDYLDEMVEQIAKDGGWQRVKFFLSGIDSVGDDYYYINGYENAETLQPDTLDNIVSDLLTELFNNI